MASATLTPQEQLQARLADPRTIDSLNRLLDRIDVLAFSAEMMDSFLQRSPQIIDSMAETVGDARTLAEQSGGAGLLEKFPMLARAGVKAAETATSPAFERLLASGLLERLADPRTIDSLKSLLDRLEVAAFTLQALDGLLQRADVIANSIADSVAEIRETGTYDAVGLVEKLPQMAAAGADLAELSQKPEFKNLTSLVEKVGKPETIEKLGALVEKLDLAVFALDALDGFIRRGPDFTEAIAAGVDELRQSSPGIDTTNVQKLASDMLKLLVAGQKLVASGLLDKLDELANTGLMLSKAGMFEPRVVNTLGEVGRIASESYAAARKAPSKRLGMLGMLRLLNDPAAQPALSLLAEATREFGNKIR
jgi:hypothetical protein